MLADRGTGLGLPGLRWERGPSLMPAEGFFNEALAEPGVLSGLGALGAGAGATGSAGAGGDLGATLVQPWFADALTESLRGAFAAPARQAEARERPGRAMGFALSRALGASGPVAERLRALVAAGGETSESTFAAMGWDGVEHLRSDSGRGLPPPGGERGSPSDLGDLPAMAPMTDPGAMSVPLGLQPTGTSMDMGKLTSLMLRPGPASQLDFNLVAPVSVAMSQAAHLKPEDEAVGGHEAVGAASGEDTEGGGPSDEPLRIPDEIIDLLSHEIAGRIGDRMKFEQDRRGRWD